MTSLKPCPFCGRKPIGVDKCKDELFNVSCNFKGCSVNPFTVYFHTEYEAINAWNLRNEKDDK